MNEWLEFAIRAVLIGIGATVVMDLWAVFLKRCLDLSSLDYGLVGRWLGHFTRGRFLHDDIAEASPVQGELMIGWSAHYVIGIIFAFILVAIWGLDWAYHPTLLPALFIGVVTVVAPFFLMQPGMGAGIAASKTPNPNLARLRSIIAHTAYGIGLYLSAWFWTLLI